MDWFSSSEDLRSRGLEIRNAQKEQSGKLLTEGVARVTLQRILMPSQCHLAVHTSLVSCMAALHTVMPSALSLALGDRLPGDSYLQVNSTLHKWK